MQVYQDGEEQMMKQTLVGDWEKMKTILTYSHLSCFQRFYVWCHFVKTNQVFMYYWDWGDHVQKETPSPPPPLVPFLVILTYFEKVINKVRKFILTSLQWMYTICNDRLSNFDRIWRLMGILAVHYVVSKQQKKLYISETACTTFLFSFLVFTAQIWHTK